MAEYLVKYETEKINQNHLLTLLGTSGKLSTSYQLGFGISLEIREES